MEYQEDMAIDDTCLDIEILDQPELVLKYTQLCEDAKKEVDEEKEELDLLAAQIDYEVRSDPKKFGIEIKLTETVVLNTIKQAEEWQAKNKIYLTSRHTYGILKGAIKAVEHRKTSLELLVKLYNSNYFAGPSVPRDLNAERKKKQKKADELVGSKMKRRRN